MKYISKVIILLLIPALATAQGKITVVSSASIFQDMAINIGGDKIEAFSIVPIGGDPHLYEPKPSDAQLVKSANIILVNGLTFEGWINKLIANSGSKAKVYTITEGVDVIKSDRYKNAADPHAWMDASNGLKYIENIKDALVKTDPKNADFYTTNYEKYKSEITALDTYIATEIKKIPEAKRMLVTSHDAFAYYGKRYNIKLNALKGISTEAETQTSDMVRVAKAIQESGVPAIFIESTINPQVIQQIARDNNVKIGGELFADSIGDQDSEGPTYVQMLRHNTDVIVLALSQNTMTATKIDSDNLENGWLIYLIVGLIMLGALVFAVTKFNK
jgi:ABC-type Zn uptake system ZnuABC Zn-binding protein ZnuA